MSSFADQMEHTDSSHSFPSRRSSETGSVYMLESGLFISSYAATVLISALVTLGILFFTVVVALTVMLQSCQNNSSGNLESWSASEDYQYCRIWALHADINKLKTDAFPEECLSHVAQHITEHHYLRDLILTIRVANSYFSSFKAKDSDRDVVLIDIDDVPALSHGYNANLVKHRFDIFSGQSLVGGVKHQIDMLLIELHMKLRDIGLSLIFISRKPATRLNSTAESLISSGYGGWSSLIMRSEEEMQMETSVYFTKRRTKLQSLGFRVTGIISSQLDVLSGSCSEIRMFKLPKSIYYNLDRQYEIAQGSQ